MSDIFQDMETLVSVILEKNSIEIGDIPALISDDIFMSHLELKSKVLKVIATLEKENLDKDICIGLRFNDHIMHCVFYLALLKMGIIQASINPHDVEKNQLKIINDINIDLVIQDISLDDLLKEETICVDENFYIKKTRYEKLEIKATLPTSVAVIFLGSGTSGKEKLMAIDSTVLAAKIKHSLGVIPYNAKEQFFCYSELYYPFSRRSLLVALLSGMTFLLPKKKPKDIILFCIKNRVDHLQLTGSQGSNILLKNKNNFSGGNMQLPKLKSCILSSSLITQPVRKDVMSYITPNLFIIYGTNEFGIISIATADDINKYSGSVGKVNSNVTLRIVDDNANDCEMGIVGHILVKTPNMIHGYRNNLEATKKAFTKDGYYPGDLGRLTQDGNLILEGRKDDMMIFHGVNIYPRELESVLESHPNVIESAVFPITVNNNTGVPFAVVAVSKKIGEIELLKWCQEVSGWCRPQRIFFTNKLPRNSAGKILKRDLAKKIVEVMNS